MTAKPEVPHQGGSYVRTKDGSLVREEFTRQPGEPEPAAPTTVPENADEASATPRKRR